jgi:hypothetical protein
MICTRCVSVSLPVHTLFVTTGLFESRGGRREIVSFYWDG